MKTNDIMMIGLGVMGRNLVWNMADHGYDVAAYNRSYHVSEEMMQEHQDEHVTIYKALRDGIASLKKPRRIMMMVKAGKAVDMVIEQIIPYLEEGDMIIDGGNSFYEDSVRRSAYLKEKGIHFFGVGISGGEDGARFGPSIMPGGNQKAYAHIKPILESISAKAEDGKPCCSYIGSDGAGHYVKMVHNGIEYADMQLIAEAYLLLKYIGGYSNLEMSDIFSKWNQGELNSFLIEITAAILKEHDDLHDGELLDYILDSAAQKGTGRWASIEALKQGIDISMITAACNARVMSNRLALRKDAHTAILKNTMETKGNDAFVEAVRQSLYAAKVIAYAQGFDLLNDASKRYAWNLNLADIASIFRAGCIIQAQFLNDIVNAYTKEKPLTHLLLDDFFVEKINAHSTALRTMSSKALQHAIPIPAMSNAIAYLDMFTSAHMGANLIQAQRDYFGAHTYKRIDDEIDHHHDWRNHHA